MLKRLPTDDAVVCTSILPNCVAPESLQLLDGSKVGEDPEYQSFVRKTEFDYKQDLDTAMVAFAPKAKYMLLKGRFDWKALKSYVLSTDGRCNNSLLQNGGQYAGEAHLVFPQCNRT